MKNILPIVVLFGFVFLAYQITQSRPDAASGFRGSAAKLKVEVINTAVQGFPITIRSFGTIEPRTKGGLFALVPGQIINIDPAFKAGGYFAKDQVLLEIDPAEYEIQLQTALGDVAQAKLSLSEEQARYSQAQNDWRKEPNSAKATDHALRKPHLAAAEAQLQTAEAQLRLARLNLTRTKVKAPYEGRIESTAVDVGSVISSTLELAKIYSIDSVEVRLPVKHRDIPFIDLPSDNAQIDAAREESNVAIINGLYGQPQVWPATLDRTEASIDKSSQQLYVVSSIARPFDESSHKEKSPLKIGQYVNAEIEGRVIQDKVVIPNHSIYQGHYVYIVEDGLLKRRNLEILWRDKEQSVVSSGLVEGDLLVVTPLGQVASGTEVDWSLQSSALVPQ